MKDEKRRAGFADEVLMMNLAIFHLLLPVVPTIVIVMVLFVLETTALSHAKLGESPKR